MSWSMALVLFPALAALAVTVSIVRERDLAARPLRLPLYTGAAFLPETQLDDLAVVPQLTGSASVGHEKPRAIA